MLLVLTSPPCARLTRSCKLHQEQNFIYVPYFKISVFKFKSIETCKESKSLSYLQAKKLAYHNLFHGCQKNF